ncbi:MAG TPA: hypothetical protein VFU51_08695 [Gaiellaceae bacterium]|jgi:hypothetical protein|nr:hypothetical protein [Gaiellaceae bacterium]
MEDLGRERIHGRPTKLFPLTEWAWEEPGETRRFTLLIAASAFVDDAPLIRRFAVDAVAAGCVWGEDCERVEELFDQASIAADRFVMSTCHRESLADALYFALVDSILEDVSATESATILAVEPPWLAEVRRLVADQDELARLWGAEE